MLSPQIKELISKRFGHPLNTKADFVRLSDHMYSAAGAPYNRESESFRLSPEVLEKMFSESLPHVYPGGSALNTLAQYLGYYYWDYVPGYDTVEPEINKQYHKETKHWRKQFVRNRLLLGYIPVLVFILVVGCYLWYKFR